MEFLLNKIQIFGVLLQKRYLSRLIEDNNPYLDYEQFEKI